MPCRATFGFNPSNPGHWLQNWFYIGGEQTKHGFYKEKLYATGADSPIGDAEFIFAKATDNIYLPEGYVDQTLAGLPTALKRRYLEGMWEYTDGTCFFDLDSLDYYSKLAADNPAKLNGRLKATSRRTSISVFARSSHRMQSRSSHGQGPLTVWKSPVRGEKPHRYVIGLDSSSGRGEDWTAMQVLTSTRSSRPQSSRSSSRRTKQLSGLTVLAVSTTMH
jgi:hypothetical protein